MPFSVGSIVAKLELGIEGWKKSIETVKKDQESMTGFAMRHSQEIENLGKKMALAGAAITAALSAVVITTSHAGDQFDEMSAKTGISTETLSTLKLAADKSGTSIDSVAAGMKFLATQMIETSTATDKSKTVLGALGISATDTSGKLRPMNDVLFDVAEKFKGMEDGALKTKLAVVIFGRAGMDMIPILNLGRKGLEENEAAARKLGIEWSGPAAKAAAAFDDSIKDLKASGTGLSKTIGETLMPTVKAFVESATGGISALKDFAKAHQALTSTTTTLALGMGGVLTISGGLLIMIGSLMKALASLGAAAVVVSGSLAILTAGVGVLVYGYIKMHEAAANVIAAQDDLIKQESIMIGCIADAAVKVGIHGKAFENLTEKYKGNTLAMLDAILAGDEGTAMQKALNDEMTKARHVSEAQAKATKEVLNPALQALLDLLDKNKEKTKTLAETLNLVFTADQRKRLEDIAAALKKYKDDLPESEVRRLNAEQRKLNDELATGGLVLGMVEQRLKALENPLQVITAHMEALGKIGAGAFGKMGIESRVVVDKIESIWKNMNEQIVADFIQSVADIFIGQKSLLDGFKGITDSIVTLWVNAMINVVNEGMKAGKSVGDIWKDMKAAATESTAGIVGIIIAMSKAINSIFQELGWVTTDFGKKIGDAFGGVTGILGDVIAKIFGIKSATEKAAEAADALKNYKKQFEMIDQVHGTFLRISDETAKSLMELTKKFGAAGAEARMLTEIMEDTGINIDNFDHYLGKATNTLTLMEKGLLDVKTGTALADEQFALLLEAAKKFGKEGSEAMVNFIKTSREMGLEVESVTKYVQGELDKIPASLKLMIIGVGDSADALKGMGDIALLTFNSMLASGVSWTDAVFKMGDPLKALAQRYVDLGLTADPALAELMKIVGVTEAHKGLFDALSANDQVLKALGNSGWLTADSLKILTKNANDYYNELIATGLTADEALSAMGPTLQDIYDYSKTYGITLDDNTQKLIDQAKAAGKVKDKVDIGDILSTVNDTLDKIYKLWCKIYGIVDDTATRAGDITYPGESGEGGGGGGGGTCFVAGTPITMADGSTRPIEQIKVGDDVLSYDTKMHKSIAARVSATFAHAPEEVDYTVEINGQISATPEHPFYINVNGVGIWKRIGDARIGDRMWTTDGISTPPGWFYILTKKWGPGGIPVYNIHVDHESHSYFAGGVLVHNKEQREGYQHGGYVPETGLALLHAGEYVIPPGLNRGFVNASIPVVNNYYFDITIPAIDGPSVERLFKGQGREIFVEMIRQNKDGMTRDINKYLKAMG